MPGYNDTYDFAIARFNAVFHNRLRFMLNVCLTVIRGTQREYTSKPLKHSIVKRVLVFINGGYGHIFIPYKFFICSDFLAESLVIRKF